MKPTIGRIVHYVPVYAPLLGEDPKPLPAIIIEVLFLPDESCRLGVFGTTGYQPVSPVPHIEPSEDGYPVAGAWFWPPKEKPDPSAPWGDRVKGI